MKACITTFEQPDCSDKYIQSLVDGGGSPPAAPRLSLVHGNPTQVRPYDSLCALLSLKHGARRVYAQQLTVASADSIEALALGVPAPSAVAGYRYAKRALDVVVSAVALVVLLPVFILIAALIVAGDGGPVLYYQPRVGMDGKTFRFYKFRSMCRNADRMKAALQEYNEADGGIFKMRNDPRITPVGRVLRRYSLDELPQLVSVLLGDMSLIGPRPMVVNEARMCDARQWQRHKTKPGLLCLREICGRSGLSFHEWVELDLLYVACQSLRTDLKILSCSIPSIISSEHAY